MNIKHLIAGLGAGLLVPFGINAAPQACADPMDTLIAAIAEVESGTTCLWGDSGQAYGILQIHKEVILDVNRIYGTDYTLLDRSDAEKSKQICRMYLEFWGKQYEKTNGKNKKATFEVYARIWNGGPKGYLKSATKTYWLRVSKCLERPRP